MIRFLCPLCEYSTVNLSNLRMHFKAKHEPYCFSCGKKFKKFSGLSAHSAKRRDEYHLLLLYLSCRRPSRELAELASKLISLEPPRRRPRLYLCPFCSYKARSLGVLKTHFKSHKPYCPPCGREFKSMHSLVNHCSKRRDEYHVLLLYLSGGSKIRSMKNMIELGIVVSSLIGVEECGHQTPKQLLDVNR